MAKYCIGIDLGGTFIKFGLLDEHRKPGKTLSLRTPTGKGSRGVVEQMIAGAHKVMDLNKASRTQVVGVGMGVPGPLKISEGIIIAMPNIPGMDNVPVRDLVGEALGLPAVLENDANAAGYGEYLSFASEGVRDMVLLTLGTGVGSGIVIDGKVLHGVHEIGGEIGHMIVEPDGERCGCGQQGCLERYCSATYMAQWVTRMLFDRDADPSAAKPGQATRFAEPCNKLVNRDALEAPATGSAPRGPANPVNKIEAQGRESSLLATLKAKGAIDAKDINEARKAGDALAAEAWDRSCRFLAIACVNIARVLDPDQIVFGGGMAAAGDDLLAPVQTHYRKMHWSLTEPLAKVALARLGNDAGVIGAAGVAWQTFGAKA